MGGRGVELCRGAGRRQADGAVAGKATQPARGSRRCRGLSRRGSALGPGEPRAGGGRCGQHRALAARQRPQRRWTAVPSCCRGGWAGTWCPGGRAHGAPAITAVAPRSVAPAPLRGREGEQRGGGGLFGFQRSRDCGGVPGGPGGVTDRGRPCPHPQGTRWPTAWPAAAPTRSPRWRSAPPSGSSRPPSWPQSPRTSSGCPPRPGRAGASRWRPPSSPPRGEVRPRGHGPGTAGGQGRWRGREPRTWRQEAWARPAQQGPQPRASTTLPSCPGAGASRARPRPPTCRSRLPRPPRPTCQAPGPVLWLGQRAWLALPVPTCPGWGPQRGPGPGRRRAALGSCVWPREGAQAGVGPGAQSLTPTTDGGQAPAAVSLARGLIGINRLHDTRLNNDFSPVELLC